MQLSIFTRKGLGWHSPQKVLPTHPGNNTWEESSVKFIEKYWPYFVLMDFKSNFVFSPRMMILSQSTWRAIFNNTTLDISFSRNLRQSPLCCVKLMGLSTLHSGTRTEPERSSQVTSQGEVLGRCSEEFHLDIPIEKWSKVCLKVKGDEALICLLWVVIIPAM